MNLPELEELFFNLSTQISEPAPVFIVGSPRTGSTPLYQAVASAFSLPYISNFVNDQFAQFPIVGFALQRGVQTEIEWKNEFGKTKGEFQLSEGSAVISRWFGGGHPSQLVSREIIKGQEAHLKQTMAAVEFLYNKPLVIKNPWNCFRIETLAKELEKARFIWIRRDIAMAAKSDLEARYITKGTPYSWNSATPANVEQLMRLEPPAQVVENQFEFNKALKEDMTSFAQSRYLEIWYEDFVTDPRETLNEIEGFIESKLVNVENLKKRILKKSLQLSQTELMAIEEYVNSSPRFGEYRYQSPDDL